MTTNKSAHCVLSASNVVQKWTDRKLVHMLVKKHGFCLPAPPRYQTASAPEHLPDTISDSLITNYTGPFAWSHSETPQLLLF